MRAHDFVVQLHAGSYCLRNLVTAVNQRRRGADDDFVVALVFRQLVLENQEVFHHRRCMLASVHNGDVGLCGEYSMPAAAVSLQIFTISV